MAYNVLSGTLSLYTTTTTTPRLSNFRLQQEVHCKSLLTHLGQTRKLKLKSNKKLGT